MSVVLPLPVLPTIAVVSPGAAAERDAAQDRLLGARVAELDVAELDDAAVAAVGGGTTGDVRIVDRGLGLEDLRIRPDETAARGTRMNMNTAVSTANRICMQVLQERGQVADRQLARCRPGWRRTTGPRPSTG